MDIQKYLIERITHLKNEELRYFNDSIDQSISKPLRDTYRHYSNQFEARRRELEILLHKIS